MIVDINFLPELDYKNAVSFLHEKFSPKDFKIVFYWSPFAYGYNVNFGLSKKDKENYNPFNDSEGLAKNLYKELTNHFNDVFQFDELDDELVRYIEIEGTKYPQYDHLLNFLIANGYDCPKERVARYSINSTTKEKRYYRYGLRGQILHV